MQGVYSHSFYKLLAIATSSGVHGLFPTSDIDHVRCCEVETNWIGGDPERSNLVPKRYWDEQLDYASLPLITKFPP